MSLGQEGFGAGIFDVLPSVINQVPGIITAARTPRTSLAPLQAFQPATAQAAPSSFNLDPQTKQILLIAGAGVGVLVLLKVAGVF